MRARRRAPLLLVFALIGAAIVPWYAFYQGHPLRIRYGLPLVAACAAITAVGMSTLWRPLRMLAALAVVSWITVQSSAFDARAPMITEAQRDATNRIGRQAVTAYLRAHWDGTTIMMSMGSLAHYMQELSADGFRIADFIHEGNGALWTLALATGPAPHAGWMLIEEQSEGGDVLARRVREDVTFMSRMERVCEGGGVALYKRR